MNIEKEDILKKQIVNYMLAKTYQDKTNRDKGLEKNDKSINSQYMIYTNKSKATDDVSRENSHNCLGLNFVSTE